MTLGAGNPGLIGSVPPVYPIGTPAPQAPAAFSAVNPTPPVTPVQPVTPVPPVTPVAPTPSVASPTPDTAATQTITTPAATPTTPATPTFTGAAQSDLADAKDALGAVDKSSVKLSLDRQSVMELLAIIGQARDLVSGVRTSAATSLDVELKFGNNWVSDAIGRRLHDVAVGNEGSAVSVVGDFLKVLVEVEETIRKAVRNLEDAEEEVSGAVRFAGGGRS
ncbi:hypothetical protein [Actinosynnema sp. NPDC020468]|uniref:hypothetical protein n=1 Tax=Actinosynnema sp. NPDC020468 TaxID=3154488 RepID=UPI0033F278E6